MKKAIIVLGLMIAFTLLAGAGGVDFNMLYTKAFSGAFLFGTMQAEAVNPIDSTDSFRIKWYDFKPGLTDHSVKLDVQNMNEGNTTALYLRLLFSNTNYPIEETTATISIYDVLPTPIPTYNNRTIKRECKMFDNKTLKNVIYDCSYKESFQNGTVIKSVVQWISDKANLVRDERKDQKKLGIFTEVNGIKADYKLIRVPKFGSEKEFDDLGKVKSDNGIVTFMIEWTTPLVEDRNGFGSSGSISIEDNLTGNVYT